MYDQLLAEASAYSHALDAKPHVVVLTKRDLYPGDHAVPTVRAPRASGMLVISAVAGVGLQELGETLWRLLVANDAVPEADVPLP